MQLGYGIEVLEHNDPYVRLAEEALQCAAACAKAGAYLVDVFPVGAYSHLTSEFALNVSPQ